MLSLQLLGVQNRLCHSILWALAAENLLEAVGKTSSNSICMKLYGLSSSAHCCLQSLAISYLHFPTKFTVPLHLQIFPGFFPSNFPPSLPSPPLHQCQNLDLYLAWCQCQLVRKGQIPSGRGGFKPVWITKCCKSAVLSVRIIESRRKNG